MAKKPTTIKIADIPQLVDALFIWDQDRPGWVTAAVNAKGRDYVEALFPRARITWRDVGDIVPADWRGSEINVPDVVAATETKLPMEVIGGVNLDEATPDTLASLLAAGVFRQGGRSATYDFFGGCLKIYRPTSSNN